MLERRKKTNNNLNNVLKHKNAPADAKKGKLLEKMNTLHTLYRF